MGQVVLAEDDPTVNRLLAAQCAQCHGTNGYAVGDMDSLSDESYKDLYEDLMDMISEDRPEDIMDHQALGYTPDQIRRIALYYGMRSGKADEAPEVEGGEKEEEEEKEHEEEEH
jgi:cytochrome c553